MPAISLFMPTNDPETRDEAVEWNAKVLEIIERMPFLTPRTTLRVAQDEYFGSGPGTREIIVCPNGHGANYVYAFFDNACNFWELNPEDHLECLVCGADMEEVDYADLASV